MAACYVGVPIEGEKVCPICDGTGSDPLVGYQPMGGCDSCHATGVVSGAWEERCADPEWQDHCGDPNCTYCPPVSGVDGHL